MLTEVKIVIRRNNLHPLRCTGIHILQLVMSFLDISVRISNIPKQSWLGNVNLKSVDLTGLIYICISRTGLHYVQGHRCLGA